MAMLWTTYVRTFGFQLAFVFDERRCHCLRSIQDEIIRRLMYMLYVRCSIRYCGVELGKKKGDGQRINDD